VNAGQPPGKQRLWHRGESRGRDGECASLVRERDERLDF